MTPAASQPDTLGQDIQALTSRVASLHSEAQLTRFHDAVEGITAALAGLPAAIRGLRDQGYLYSGGLEAQVEALRQQWETMRPDLLRQAQNESRNLAQQATLASNQVQALQTTFARSADRARALFPSASSTVQSLESKIQGVESRLCSLYGGLNQQIYPLKRQVDRLTETVKQFRTATFALQPGESPIDTSPATYLRDRDEGFDGLLYLTNYRLLFEHKEEVAKKKVLFVATEKELVQRLLLDQPVGYVDDVAGSEKGFSVFKKEQLTVRFKPEAGLGVAYFQLKEDSEDWQALLRRVVSGEIEQERVGAKVEDAAERAEAEVEAARELPTACPTCGAPLGGRLARGVQNLACEYCGATIRA